MTGNKYGSAAAVRREVAEYLRPPRRMPIAEGIKQFMFVPRGANTAVPPCGYRQSACLKTRTRTALSGRIPPDAVSL
ncbi:phage terminase large subunit [Salmonella enterica]|nr:phage terminase large subunit [Salmonella enterica]